MAACPGKALWRVIPGFMLGLVLVACGGQSGPSPEQVHIAWLQALRDNDREQALELFADMPGKDIEVAAALTMIQNEMHRPLGQFGYGGKLLSMRALTTEMRGAGRVGWSRWQYAKEERCHRTDLSQAPKGWRVVDFNLANPEDCRP